MERLTQALKDCSRSNWQGLEYERLGLLLTQFIDRWVKASVRRKAQEWSLSDEDVEDICQETAIGFVLSARAGYIDRQANGNINSDLVAAYLYRVLANKFHGSLRKSGQATSNKRGSLLSLQRALARLVSSSSESAREQTPDLLRALTLFFRSYSLNFTAGKAPAGSRKRFLEVLIREVEATGASEVLAMSAEDFEGWLSKQARMIDAELMPKVTPSSKMVDSHVKDESGASKDLLAEYSAAHPQRTDQDVWEELRSLKGHESARDIVVSYLMLRQDRPGQINRLVGTSKNTPRNIVNRVASKLRGQLTGATN